MREQQGEMTKQKMSRFNIFKEGRFLFCLPGWGLTLDIDKNKNTIIRFVSWIYIFELLFMVKCVLICH